MVGEGDQVPDVRLDGVDGKSLSPADFKGQKLVLYFYPKDDTSGCTREAQDFTSFAEEFEKAGTWVLGNTVGNMIANGVAGNGKMSAIAKALIAEAERSANTPASTSGQAEQPSNSDASGGLGGEASQPGDIVVTARQSMNEPYFSFNWSQFDLSETAIS